MKNLLLLSRSQLLLLIYILIIAAIPRSIELINHNYLWGYDQGEYYLAVEKMVTTHKPTLIGTKVGGAGGFFQGPGWYYLLTIPYILAGGDPYGGMILMFACGLATVALAFYVTLKMFNTRTAFIVTFLLAISPGIIPQSRFIWPPFPISLLTVLYLFFLFKVLQGNKKYLLGISLVIGLMAHFEIATAGTVLLQFIIFIPLLLLKRFTNIRFLLLSLLIFILTLSPLVLFDIRNNHLIIKGILSEFTSPTHTIPFFKIVENHFTIFWGNFMTTFFATSLLWPLYCLSAILGTYVFIVQNKKHAEQNLFLLYLLTSPFTLFIVFLLYKQGIWDWWILELPIMYCFLVGIILSNVFSKIKLMYIILLAFFIAYTLQTYTWFKNDFNDYGGVHKIKGKLDALDFIYKDSNNQPEHLLIFTPPVYTYAYDYLIHWYGKRKYQKIPDTQKKETFYLLIEPDPSKPWSYKGWLETVIKDGAVIKTTTLQSGFIVQKRKLTSP